MRLERITVTPHIASEMLAKNIDRNRPIRPALVAKYANDMTAGFWLGDNGETIKFNDEGNLIDGQHRLSAIVKSRVTVTVWACFGLSTSAFLTIDTGASRNTGNIMHIGGEIDANKKAALVRNLLKLRLNSCKFPMATFSVSTVVRAYEKEKVLIDESYKFADALARKSQFRMKASLIGSFVALINNENIKEFFFQVCTGRDVTNNVIHLLRDRLISNAGANIKMPTAMTEELTLKAYTIFKEQKEVKLLKLDEDVKITFSKLLKPINN